MNDEAIDQTWQAGRAAWPGLALDRDRFAAHVGARESQAVERFAADLYLAAACLAGEPTAPERFEREQFAVRTALMMRRSQLRAREVSSEDDEWTSVVAGISTNHLGYLFASP